MKQPQPRETSPLYVWMAFALIGFGAIFGSTVMARFALVIDRMFYIWIEWIQSVQHLSGR